jgi:hypothetical protein
MDSGDCDSETGTGTGEETTTPVEPTGETDDTFDPSTHCSTGCKWSEIGNGMCNTNCKNEACSNDGTDCSDMVEPTIPEGTGTTGTSAEFDPATHCAAGCRWSDTGNSVCNPACQVSSACSFDFNDCDDVTTGGGSATTGQCAPDCEDSMLGNGLCNEACNVEACNLDD